MKRKKNNGHKKSHKIYALVVILLGLAIIALAGLLLFYVQRIEVKGNEYTSSDEIVSMVQEDQGSFNSLYLLWKYHFTDYKKPDSVENMQVSLKAPWIVQVKVEENSIIPLLIGGVAVGTAILWRIIVTLLSKMGTTFITNAMCLWVYISILHGVEGESATSIIALILWLIIMDFGMKCLKYATVAK